MVQHLFRKYQQAIMISVTLVTIITFAGLYSHTDALDRSGSGKVAVIYGKDISLPTAQRGVRKGDLCRQLAQMEAYQPKHPMMDLYQALAVNRQDARENFFFNSIVLKHEADDLGVSATEDEVFAATQVLPAFQTNGAFDSQKYTMIAQNVLPSMGFTTDDLSELVADSIRFEKVRALLGTTVAPSDGEIRESYTQLNQKTEASVVRFKLDEFLAATHVPDEDVKKLYEERKSTLKTDETRKVRFVAFVLPATDKALTGPPRVAELTKLQKQAEDFSVAMTDKNAKFDDVAAKYNQKVQESPEFPASKPPEALESSSEMAAAAYKLTKDQPNSDVLETARGYYVLQLADITPPRPLAYEEAKANLEDTLKHERAQEALNLKATDVRNKIEAAIKGGKTFAAAAQELGVKAEDFPAFSPKEPKMDQPNAMEVMQATTDLHEGQVSPVVPSSDGSLIVSVTKRLPIDEAKYKADKAQLSGQLADFQRTALFQQWLKLRRAAAQLESHFRA